MSLPNNLVRQFAKAVNEEKKTKTESSLVMGTVQKSGDKTYVQIDGSDSRTPVASTTDVLDGERVTVVIKNHEAFITGNFSAPSARSKDVQALKKVVADKVDARELTAVKADINNLHTKTLDIDGRLTAQQADIEKINTENVNISKKLTAQEAEIGTLSGDVANFKKTTTDTLEAQSGKIEQLTSDNVTINEALTAQDASIKNLETENTTVKGKLDANEASIKTIDGDVAKFKETITGTLNAHAGKINELASDNLTINETLTAQDASIKNLSSEKLSAKDIEGKFANIDFSNIQKAAIKNFFSESGMIKDLVVGDQTIAGELVGVTISGDLIKGNTVVADKLVVKGEDGLYYKLNTDGMTVEKEQTDYNSLNGQIIKAKSITATKISVDDLVAFGATIGGFKIGQDSIYSGVKETVNNTTRGIYMDNDGQIAFGDSSQYIKFYRVSEGKYKLSIAVEDLYIGSSSVADSIEEAKSTADNAANVASGAASVASTAKSTAEGAVTKADSAVSAANAANFTASGAVNAANEAKQAANNALSTADTASKTASDAASTANTAKSTADTASKTASSAVSTASNAQKTAENAVSTASSASSAATEAKNTADAANKTASNANSTASAAKKTADSANTTAGQAKSTADQANQTASNASSTANEAKSTADNATSTANAAKNAADSAKEYTDAVSSQYGYRYCKEIVVYGDRTDYYYPVYLAYGNQYIPRDIMIYRSHRHQAPDDWNPSSLTGGLVFRVKANYGEWGGVEYKCEILDFSETYSHMVGDVNVDKLYGYGICIWLRGGGSTGARYIICSDQRIEYDSDYSYWHAAIPIIAYDGGQQIGWTDGTESNPDFKWISDYPLTTPNTEHLLKLQALASANTAREEVVQLTTRVESAETSISKNNEEIALRAKKTEVTEAINNIDIGGRNLIPNSKNLKLPAQESGITYNRTDDDCTLIVKTVNSFWCSIYINLVLEKNTTYTVSVEISKIKLVDPSYAVLAVCHNPPINSSWNDFDIRRIYSIGKRIITFNTGENANIRIACGLYTGDIDNTVTFKNLKLEHGNKATDWTPAPEDYYTKTETDASIQVLSDKISQQVSTTDELGTRLSKVEQDSSSWSVTLETANAAKKAADAANKTASSASSTASDAKLTADNANKTASNANSTASAAKKTADSANTTAGQAKSTADQANQTASSAKSAADKANENASSAVSTANTAKSTADTAKSTANTARQEASDAAKTATNFMGFDSNGLVVGDRTANTLGKNVLIGNDSIVIRNGSTVLAEFADDIIAIGKGYLSQNATIDFLNGTFQIVSETYGGRVVTDLLSNQSIQFGVKSDIDIPSAIEMDTDSINMRVNDAGSVLLSNDAKDRSSRLVANVYGQSALDPCFTMSADRSGANNEIDMDTGNGVYTKWRCNGSNIADIVHHVKSTNGSTDIYQWDSSVRLATNDNLVASYDGTTPVLLSTAVYPKADVTRTLSKPVSQQPHGIVLVFAPYVNNAPVNYGLAAFFVPKSMNTGTSVCFVMAGSSFDSPCCKWIYIHDDKIVGNDVNAQSGTHNGVKYNNAAYVLTKIYGV